MVIEFIVEYLSETLIYCCCCCFFFFCFFVVVLFCFFVLFFLCVCAFVFIYFFYFFFFFFFINKLKSSIKLRKYFLQIAKTIIIIIIIIRLGPAKSLAWPPSHHTRSDHAATCVSTLNYGKQENSNLYCKTHTRYVSMLRYIHMKMDADAYLHKYMFR